MQVRDVYETARHLGGRRTRYAERNVFYSARHQHDIRQWWRRQDCRGRITTRQRQCSARGVSVDILISHKTYHRPWTSRYFRYDLHRTCNCFRCGIGSISQTEQNRKRQTYFSYAKQDVTRLVYYVKTNKEQQQEAIKPQ